MLIWSGYDVDNSNLILFISKNTSCVSSTNWSYQTRSMGVRSTPTPLIIIITIIIIIIIDIIIIVIIIILIVSILTGAWPAKQILAKIKSLICTHSFGEIWRIPIPNQIILRISQQKCVIEVHIFGKKWVKSHTKTRDYLGIIPKCQTPRLPFYEFWPFLPIFFGQVGNLWVVLRCCKVF